MEVTAFEEAFIRGARRTGLDATLTCSRGMPGNGNHVQASGAHDGFMTLLGALHMDAPWEKRIATSCFAFLSIAGFIVACCPPSISVKADASANSVADMGGQNIDLNVAPQRIVTYAPLLAPYVTIDEGMTHVFAAPKFLKTATLQTLLGRVYPSIAALKVTGRSPIPDPEQVLSWSPDFVFSLSAFSDTLRRVGFRRQVGIEFVPPQAEKSVARIWELIGAVAHKRDRTQVLMEKYTAKMSELRSMGEEFRQKPVRVLLCWGINGNWYFGARNNYFNQLIEDAGGVNLARDANVYGPAELERILSLDPEVIVILPSDDRAAPQAIYSQPQWQGFQAARNRRVYLVPSHTPFNGPLDNPPLLTWLMEILHPGTMPRLTRSVYRAIYRDTFEYDLSDDEIDSALLIAENAKSDGYERFKADGRQ